MYNVEQYVDRCIRSLENQDIDKDDYEILVIDDGSPDNSASIVEKLQTEFSNITIYHKLNGGLSSARNYGIERAQGKYCWFVDSDDYLEKNVLKTLLYQLETHELDYVGFNLYDVIQGKKCKGTEWREKPSNVMSGTEYIKSAPIVKSACVHILKTDIYKKNNLRFVEGIIHEDYEFMLRIYRFCNRMKFLELPIYNYVIRESGSITTIKTYAQNRYSFNSWFIVINSLQNCFRDSYDEYSCYAQVWINSYKYVALTNLLTKALPFKEKETIYSQYKNSGFFKIGANHLSLKRKIRIWIYRIPFIYLILMYLLNKNGK